MSAIYRIFSYCKHCLCAVNTLGHGIHSPYLFYVAAMLVPEKYPYYCFSAIEKERRRCIREERKVYVEDFGTGKSGERSVGSMCRNATEKAERAQLLFRLVNFCGAKEVVELGTNLGFTTAYLASACVGGRVRTFEGSEVLAKEASDLWNRLHLINKKKEDGSDMVAQNGTIIEEVVGNIDETLSNNLPERIDFAFLDANHTQEATLRYFDAIKAHCHRHSIVVLDDIHHSKGMASAWKAICGAEGVSATMDLFHMGIVFFNSEFPKRTFVVRS